MQGTLTLVTTDHAKHNFEILTVAWVSKPGESYIEIAAKNNAQQTLARFKPGEADPLAASRLHDKIMTAAGKAVLQVTAYVESATVSTTMEIRLDESTVYLFV